MILEPNMQQTVQFVMVDVDCNPVPGLGAGFVVQYAKGQAVAFGAAVGARGEIGLGWYWYELLAAEVGPAPLPVALDMMGAGGAYQRLELQVSACPTIVAPFIPKSYHLPTDKPFIRRGDTWRQPFRDLGNLTTATNIIITVKQEQTDTLDVQAILKIDLLNGLLRINGIDAQAAGWAADGSIIITDAARGNIVVYTHQDQTLKLTPKLNLYFDIQIITPTDVITLTRNARLDVFADVTRDVT